MPLVALVVIASALQATAMFFDEGRYHRRRGLPRWERLGHPLDTLTVAIPYAWALVADPRRASSLAVYVTLAFFSCLFVTKDEPVHARLCPPGEHWLHAFLFIMHPIVFLAVALLWRSGHDRWLLAAQLGLTVLFGLYQLIAWSPPWRPAREP
jgi:hypothetical protein